MDVGMVREYKVPLIFAGITLVLLIASIILMIKISRPVAPIQFSTATELQATQSAQIAVDIQGAISDPGLYYLPVGSRVEDLLQKAGGVRDDAAASFMAKSLNRASVLRDGMKVYIPSEGEVVQSMTSHNNTTDVLGTSENGSNPVSINGASAAELEELSGIGPATSGKIISGRPYGSIDELVTKKIISKNLFEKLKNQLTL